MPLDLEDYNKWADDFKQNGGEPSIKGYLRHLIYKEINQDGKNTKNNQNITVEMTE